MVKKPAIVAIGYNRPNSMKRLLESIGRAIYKEDDITLIISIDKSEISNQVAKVADDFNWEHGEKIIRCFDERQGLKKHIIQCGDFSIEYDSVIILEDDLIVSPCYYQYVQEALTFYGTEENIDDSIVGISLYSHQWNGFADRFFYPVQNGADVYLGQFSISWGQCWPANQWIEFKKWFLINDGKLKNNKHVPERITNFPETSWGKYFAHFMAEKNKYYIVPHTSMSTNFTEVGQHSEATDNVYQVPLLYGEKPFIFKPIKKLVKYDMFFERLATEYHYSAEILEKGITIDLYNTKNDFPENRYLLSTELKPYKVIGCYGLIIRPQEMNVILSIKGNDIFLYDLAENVNSITRKKYNNIIKYELRGLHWKNLLIYALAEFRKALIRKLIEKR